MWIQAESMRMMYGAWCVVHCQGGIVRHYRGDQIRVYVNSTFNIVKLNNE